jgi:hypothetical protein
MTTAERITRDQLELRAVLVSNRLRGLSVEVQQRNGKTALDLCDNGGTIRMLAIGTKREIGEYLNAMSETLEIVGRA